MRLLFLSLTFPLPANNGHRLRTWALLRALAAEGHKVTLMAFGDPVEVAPADRTRVGEVCADVELVPLARRQLSRLGDLGGRLRALPAALPYSVLRFGSAVAAARIAARLEGEPFEAVICDVFTAVNVTKTTLPLILNHENVEHVILRRYLGRERNLAKLAYGWLEYRKLRRWEGQVCARAAAGMACSEADQSLLRDLCPALPIVPVPNVVDVGPDPDPADEDPGMVLFQGGMDWYPNRDAVSFFTEQILPRIHARVPGLKFVVAGRNPAPSFIQRFRGVAGMSFTGTVPDMRAFIARAALCVAPLRIGSGTRLKILEAAAMRKAVVSTRVGAEGLHLRDGSEILLADDPGAFADAVVTLLGDAPRRRAIGDRARQLVARDYSQGVLQGQIATVLARVAGSR